MGIIFYIKKITATQVDFHSNFQDISLLYWFYIGLYDVSNILAKRAIFKSNVITFDCNIIIITNLYFEHLEPIMINLTNIQYEP